MVAVSSFVLGGVLVGILLSQRPESALESGQGIAGYSVDADFQPKSNQGVPKVDSEATPPTPEGKPVAGKPAPQTTAEKKSAATPKVPELPPVAAESGPPQPLDGQIRFDPNLQPIVPQVSPEVRIEKAETELRKEGVGMVTMTVGGDASSLERKLSEIARARKGLAQTYHTGEERGTLVFVPDSELNAAVSAIGGAASEEWRGSASARRSRLVSDYRRQLTELNSRRAQLLVKYFEDATEVKVVDEEIERIQKGIRQLEPAPGTDRMSLIHVRFI
jgi:hypothetical protein